jgi:hypothetical protein
MKQHSILLRDCPLSGAPTGLNSHTVTRRDVLSKIAGLGEIMSGKVLLESIR